MRHKRKTTKRVRKTVSRRRSSKSRTKTLMLFSNGALVMRVPATRVNYERFKKLEAFPVQTKGTVEHWLM